MSNHDVLRTDNVLVRVMSLEQDTSTEWHHHTEVTDYFVCLSGVIKVETRDPDEHVVLLPGQRTEAKPLQVHRVSNLYQDTSEYLLLQGVGRYDFIVAGDNGNIDVTWDNANIKLEDIRNISSRDKDIYKLHTDGKSKSEISNTYDISTDRVSQICKQLAEYKQSYPPLKNLLSVRSQNILIKHFDDGHILEHPEKIISNLTPVTLLRIKNIGRIYYTEIINAFIKLGYIKPNDKWFKESRI
jgi:quercetin dioxygenase-like cupin family protein